MIGSQGFKNCAAVNVTADFDIDKNKYHVHWITLVTYLPKEIYLFLGGGINLQIIGNIFLKFLSPV